MTGSELKNYRYQCPPIGNRVRRGPRNDVMSQLELASLMGVHRNTISRWELLGDEPVPPMVPTLLIGVETMIKEYQDQIKRHEKEMKARQQDKMGEQMRGIEQRTTAELTTGEDV